MYNLHMLDPQIPQPRFLPSFGRTFPIRSFPRQPSLPPRAELSSRSDAFNALQEVSLDMARLDQGQKPEHPRISARTLYLTLYNLTFSFFWFGFLVKCLSTLPHGSHATFKATATPTRWVQTISLIEILHAATGLIKSPVSTTALQVSTRTIQVWAIWYCFPASTASSHAYPALVLAWSLADSIRYAYLACNMYGVAPGWMVWLRYSIFIPLYPVGIGAEWWLMARAIEPSREISGVLPWVFYGCLVAYVPGAWKMYTYMMKQRRKVLG